MHRALVDRTRDHLSPQQSGMTQTGSQTDVGGETASSGHGNASPAQVGSLADTALPDNGLKVTSEADDSSHVGGDLTHVKVDVVTIEGGLKQHCEYAAFLAEAYKIDEQEPATILLCWRYDQAIMACSTIRKLYPDMRLALLQHSILGERVPEPVMPDHATLLVGSVLDFLRCEVNLPHRVIISGESTAWTAGLPPRNAHDKLLLPNPRDAVDLVRAHLRRNTGNAILEVCVLVESMGMSDLKQPGMEEKTDEKHIREEVFSGNRDGQRQMSDEERKERSLQWE